MSGNRQGSPAGIARYTGANAVVQLTDTPSDAGSGGVALPTDKRVSAPTVAGDMRTVRFVDIYLTGGGTATVTYDGTAPTASYGSPIEGGVSIEDRSRDELAAMKFFVPTGTTMHVTYHWGHL